MRELKIAFLAFVLVTISVIATGCRSDKKTCRATDYIECTSEYSSCGSSDECLQDFCDCLEDEGCDLDESCG